jgi:hypothetical protein
VTIAAFGYAKVTLPVRTQVDATANLGEVKLGPTGTLAPPR